MNHCKIPPTGGSTGRYEARPEHNDRLNAEVWSIVLCGADGAERLRIRDVSSSRAFSERLAKLFNEQGLEAEHFAEAVQDFVACPEQLEKADRGGPVRI